MTPATDWPKLIRELMQANDVSERRLCADLQVCLTTLRAFLAYQPNGMSFDTMGRILHHFGYRLDAVLIGKDEKPAVKGRRIVIRKARHA